MTNTLLKKAKKEAKVFTCFQEKCIKKGTTFITGGGVGAHYRREHKKIIAGKVECQKCGNYVKGKTAHNCPLAGMSKKEFNVKVVCQFRAGDK